MRLASLFTDGAVLQRGCSLAVWGWCAPRVLVEGKLAGVKIAAPSSWQGEFLLRFPPMEAGGPYELAVSAEASGEECRVTDVLIGEVWLAGGQSNMEYPLQTFTQGDPLAQTEEYLRQGGDDPFLRLAEVAQQSLGTVEQTVSVEWKCSNAKNAPAFTAVGAWFALQLRKHLQVPVGIVSCNWGGTHIHSWISHEKLLQLPCCRAELLELENRIGSPDFWRMPGLDLKRQPPSGAKLNFAAVTSPDSGNQGVERGWARPDFNDSDWASMQVPGSWMEQRVNGLGATWCRRHVTIPVEWEGKPLILHLGGVDKHDTTYFDGMQVGATGTGFEQCHWAETRHYVIPKELTRGREHLVAVRGFSFFFGGGFTGLSEEYFLELADEADGRKLPLAGRWLAHAEYTIVPKVLTFARNAGLPRDAHPFNFNAMHCLFDGMVRPVIPFPIRGVLWYQGETDTNYENYSKDYGLKLQALIEDWRFRWGMGELPFLIVQLANYRLPTSSESTKFEQNWLAIQNQQRLVAQRLPNCALCTVTDLGEEHEIHPHDKRSVAIRLARLAFHYVYGDKSIVPEGPRFRSSHTDAEGCLRLFFDWSDNLHASDDQPIRGFEIAGPDGHFVSANVFIDGNTLLVSAESVPNPQRVRYNWACWPNGNLTNDTGLPAPTFSE